MIYRVDVMRKGIAVGSMAAISCSIKYNSTSKIMRAASLSCGDISNSVSFNRDIVRSVDALYPADTLYPADNLFPPGNVYKYEEFSFNRLSDRICPVIIDDGGNEHRCGIFLISTDPRSESNTTVKNDLELYDETFKLSQSTFDSRQYYPSGTKYTEIFSNILGSHGFTDVLIDNSALTLTTDREFTYEDNILDTLNKLLSEINYAPFHITYDGLACCVAKKENQINPKFSYIAGENSTIIPSVKSEYDVFDVPNVFIGLVSTPDSNDQIVYKKENHDLESELSIENRGYILSKTYKMDGTASLVQLTAFINDIYSRSLAVTEKADFTSAVEADHDYQDCIHIEAADLSGFYIETSWDLEFGYGGKITHHAERSVYR